MEKRQQSNITLVALPYGFKHNAFHCIVFKTFAYMGRLKSIWKNNLIEQNINVNLKRYS